MRIRLRNVPALLVALLSAPAASLGVASAQESDLQSMPAEVFAGRIAEGSVTNLSGIRVSGDVDLTQLSTVERPVRCRDCRFTGSVLGGDVIFDRIVDFGGSVFEGEVDISAVLFRDRAGFEAAVFQGPLSASSGRFLADASFAGARFEGESRFDRVKFGGGAVFSDTVFFSEAGFQATVFDAGANFTGADFQNGSSFGGASFGDRASFARARFAGEADFNGATFSNGANMGVERFAEGFDFRDVHAAGTIEFLGAVLGDLGSLSNLSTTGTLSLEGIRLAGGSLAMSRVSAARLIMDVDQVEAVPGPNAQKEVLKQLERSGRESGNLALANRARFRFLDIEGAQKEGWDRFLDRVFYRNLAGYLVRPPNPLLALLILVILAGTVRAVPGIRTIVAAPGRSAGAEGSCRRLGRALFALEKMIGKVLAGIAQALRVAVHRKADHIELKEPEEFRDHARVGVLWAEFIAYKVLFALILLSLGNSNSTIRQLLDAVTG